MNEMKDEPDTGNGYFGEHPVQVVTLLESMIVSKHWSMKEVKDEPDTCNGFFGEPPVQVTTVHESMMR